MHTEATKVVASPNISLPSPRYVSSEQLVQLLDLLMELRDLTLSRESYRRTNSIIVEIGGADRLACACFVVEPVE